MHRLRGVTGAAGALLVLWLGAAISQGADMPTTTATVPEAPLRKDPAEHWSPDLLAQVPSFRPAGFPDSESAGLQAILYDGVAVGGAAAPVFAYIGMPSTPAPAGGYPGVVLVHGGGGTAFPAYVKLWTSYGFAVLAMDWYNQRPVITDPTREGESQLERQPLAGGRRQDHVANVANMVLAHSLLRSLPQVDATRTALVGLSWGSWYGAVVAAIDPRFRGVIEIYCGAYDLSRHPIISGVYLHAAKVPMYWVASTNDQNVTPEGLQRGFDECAKLHNASMVIRLPHSHVGFQFTSCRRVAEHFLMDRPPLPRLGRSTIADGRISAPVLHEGKGIIRTILCYTTDRDEPVSHLRQWHDAPAERDGNTLSAALPPGVFQCFLSAYDEDTRWNDCCGSSDLQTLPRP